jgi:hypothetical protein
MCQWLKYASLQPEPLLRYLALAFALACMLSAAAPAYAHFFGATKDVDGFQVVFQPFPSAPVIGTNTTLNFSVLYNGSNIYNVHSAVTITEKDGPVIFQDPYRLYEISDITVPYRFEKAGSYVVTVQMRIAGHEKYGAQPLTASFDVSASPPGIPFDELLLYYATPAAVAVAAIAVYLHSRGRL